jgi:hypothetical protein
VGSKVASYIAASYAQTNHLFTSLHFLQQAYPDTASSRSDRTEPNLTSESHQSTAYYERDSSNRSLDTQTKHRTTSSSAYPDSYPPITDRYLDSFKRINQFYECSKQRAYLNLRSSLTGCKSGTTYHTALYGQMNAILNTL